MERAKQFGSLLEIYGDCSWLKSFQDELSNNLWFFCGCFFKSQFCKNYFHALQLWFNTKDIKNLLSISIIIFHLIYARTKAWIICLTTEILTNFCKICATFLEKLPSNQRKILPRNRRKTHHEITAKSRRSFRVIWKFNASLLSSRLLT